MTDLEYIVHDGVRRYLAAIPSEVPGGGLPKFSAAFAPIDRKEWHPVDYRGYAVPILDQGQHGSCVGHGAASTFWRAWLAAGNTPREFSSCYIYGKINGGRDSGANISEAMKQLLSGGVCLLATVPEGMVYSRQFPAGADAEASRFKALKAYALDTFDEIGTAFQLGFLVCGCLRVGSNYTRLDKSGVAGVSRGQGNHCEAHAGLIKIPDGRWVLPTPNSWGTTFGNGGWSHTCEDHYAYQSGVDCFALQAVAEDPEEPAGNRPL